MNADVVVVNGGSHLSTGRFAPGNRAALGNPNNRRMHELRKVFLDCTTDEQIRTAHAKLFELVCAGDVQAIKLFCGLCGIKETLAVELSGPEQGSVNISGVLSKIVAVLAPYPEARQAVAAALYASGDSQPSVEGPSDQTAVEQ